MRIFVGHTDLDRLSRFSLIKLLQELSGATRVIPSEVVDGTKYFLKKVSRPDAVKELKSFSLGFEGTEVLCDLEGLCDPLVTSIDGDSLADNCFRVSLLRKDSDEVYEFWVDSFLDDGLTSHDDVPPGYFLVTHLLHGVRKAGVDKLERLR